MDFKIIIVGKFRDENNFLMEEKYTILNWYTVLIISKIISNTLHLFHHLI